MLLTWAWHPKPLPMAVPNSFALAAAQMGHDLTHRASARLRAGRRADARDQPRRRDAGGRVTMTNDVDEAFDGAEVVYAKSWGSHDFYGAPEEDIESARRYRDDWIVDEAKMRARDGGIFMHCLPVRRNVIVTDGVIDSATSVVIDEAENRLHVQKAVMTKIAEKSEETQRSMTTAATRSAARGAAVHSALQGQDLRRQIVGQGDGGRGESRLAGRRAGAAASGRHSHLRRSRRRQAVDGAGRADGRRADDHRRAARDGRRHARDGEDDLRRQDQHGHPRRVAPPRRRSRRALGR